MPVCSLHPGRAAVMEYNRVEYCAKCQSGIISARSRVRSDIVHKDCFIWYRRNDDREPITGTGCAHWVAHEEDIHSGGTDEKCVLGYTHRVRVLIQGRSPVPLADVQSGDIYVNSAENHTGLVVRVMRNLDPHEMPDITIRHDSSRQHGLADNDFKHYFHGQGSFCR